MADSLVRSVQWSKYKLPAGATAGEIELSVGAVGSGKPTALLIAGLHGDEGPWGAWAIRKLLDSLTPEDLKGTLRLIPVSNPGGFDIGKRASPLDIIPFDMNRVFPGDPDGLHTERAAALITKYGVDGADVVIDVHGGGNWCVNSFVAQFPGSEELATVIGAPFISPRQPIGNTLVGYAHGKGAKVVLIEMGGMGSMEEKWANRIAEGIERALNHVDVIKTLNVTPPSASKVMSASNVLRPSRGGVYLPELRETDVGKIVPQGTRIGRLIDPVKGDVLETYTAPFKETAILLLRPTMIQVDGGTFLAMVSEPKKE
jgi:predicted deacylase